MSFPVLSSWAPDDPMTPGKNKCKTVLEATSAAKISQNPSENWDGLTIKNLETLKEITRQLYEILN